ncbi:DUF6265 family protein [Aureibaculum sp. 2210JD6-5]|uniref:DUF6265 family protein n=1 Tax=Aureibaculum sp. 2210JD6-5 TaxID=3103957 RepID=UPI002AADB84B|nr:DUF6265 family protein [Aureibaculum sp. 2210JD6-5]MDY7396250.1 DUF6265 family protein [Aureibaculum sp. 2210JD6-5]
MNKLLFLIGLIVIFGSCKNKEQSTVVDESIVKKKFDKIEQLQWLVGEWTNITIDQQSYETWTQLNDSTLTAYAYTTVLNDTVFQENMTIKQNPEGVVLIVSVPNQNDEKPVVFNFLPEKNDVYTFVNEKHDFPNKISYSNPVKDSIHAWIEGEIDSTYKKMDFYFKREN